MTARADTGKGRRMAMIYSHLIRNRTRSHTMTGMLAHLHAFDPMVSRRNVERDLRDLADLRAHTGVLSVFHQVVAPAVRKTVG